MLEQFIIYQQSEKLIFKDLFIVHNIVLNLFISLYQISQSQIFNNRYVVQKTLGKGAYGIIYACYDKQTKRTVAVKKIKIEKGKQPDFNEINLLKELHHPNIVQYYDSFQTQTDLFIVIEYCEGGSLQQQNAQFGTFSEELVSNITYQILQALVYLHSHGILHRDLKCANILCDKQMHIKVTDFGISEKITSGEVCDQQIVGSPFWIAREVLLQQGISEKSDIWSLGATLYELISGNPPYNNLEPLSAMYRIMTDTEIPNIPTKFPEATQMIRKCFIFDPKLRPSAKDLLKESFITRFNKVEGINSSKSIIAPLLLQNFSLSEDSASESDWSEDNEDQSQSAACRRKSKQAIQKQQEISYALQEEIKMFIQNSLRTDGDKFILQIDKISNFSLEEVNDQTKQLSVFIYDVIQSKQAFKSLIDRILQENLNLQYKQTIFSVIGFLMLNLQQQTKQDLYVQILMNKYLQTMNILNNFIMEQDNKDMIRVLMILLQTISQSVNLIQVFVSLGGIQQLFSQPMLYLKSREIAIQAVQCISIIIDQQDWKTYYTCFISNNNIYSLLLKTLKNFALYSMQNPNKWNQYDQDFAETQSDYDHRQLREHASEHFDHQAPKIYQENSDSITNILKICQSCGQQQILSINSILKEDNLCFIYQLTEFFTQCYKTRKETQLSQKCSLCKDMQNKLQIYLSLLVDILTRIHQYVFKSNYQLQNIQKIIYDNLDKIMELEHTSQELNTKLVLIIFGLFNIDDKYEFIRGENSNYLQLLLNQKGEIQYGVIKHMAEMPIDLYNITFIQRILDYNIANQLVTYLSKEKETILLYYKLLNQLYQFRNMKNKFKGNYKQKIQYQSLIEKAIQNFENSKLIANICVFSFSINNFVDPIIINDFTKLASITPKCSKFILESESTTKLLFQNLDYKNKHLIYHLHLGRVIFNQANDVRFILQDMELQAKLYIIITSKQTSQQATAFSKQWLTELSNCKYLL